ncbi:MAG: peptidyl-prolyl cis-trans isomerase [Candidatus Omnitrophica bacterium]|nr:peptidyl-prolyl cis-trans isomerase [Candidatus Omnitrophota bacterium]
MKTFFKYFFVILFLLGGWVSSAQAVDDAIVAVVNKELITMKDLKDYLHSTYVSLVADGMDPRQIDAVMKDLEANGIEKMIEDKIILSYANEKKMEIRESGVDERVDQLKSQYRSEADFMTDLVSNGSNLTDLRHKIRDQLKIKYIIDNEIREKITVNPKEVEDFFSSNKDQFKRKESLSLDSIYIAFGTNKQAARKKIEAALDRVKKGDDFKKIAADYSDTPSIGTIERGQLRDDIETKLLALKMDETSDIFEVENGYFIFKLLGHSPEKIAAYEDVKNFAYEVVYRRKFKEKFEKWLLKLKAKTYVEIKK